jgi:hypothetical protein
MVSAELLELALPLPSCGWHDHWLALVAATYGSAQPVEAELLDYRLHATNLAGVPGRGLRIRWTARNSDLSNHTIEDKLWRELLARCESRPPAPDRAALIESRVAVTAWRKALPSSRMARLPGITSALASGRYRRLSTGLPGAVWDALRHSSPVS